MPQRARDVSRPHRTLRPGTNITLIVVWGLAATALFLKGDPRPFLLVGVGGFFGLLGGLMQTRAFEEARGAFLETSSLLEVRERLKATKWGKRYLMFLWGGNFTMGVLALAFTTNPVLSVLVGYFTFMFIREIVTLKPTFELYRLQRATYEDTA